MRKIFYLFLCCLALTLSGCARATSSPTPPAGGAPAGGLVLGECKESIPNLPMRGEPQCGTLRVYEDRAAGTGRQIELSVVVIPAVSRNPAPDPLFFIPGGPGESAAKSYPVVAAAFEKVNQKRAIVLVDQRGTGKSHPLTCDFGADAESGDSSDPAAAQRLYQKCLQSLDADPRFYTTAIAMDDLDQVRAALGYDQINLYGASYGTRAALAYLRQHPDHTRSVILDGVAPPDWTLGDGSAAIAQRALDQLFARCAADAACRNAFPDLPAEFQGLLERLAAQPVSVSLDHPITGEPTTTTFERSRFVNTVHQMSYTAETAALLPLLIHTAYAQNDFQRFAALTLSTETDLGEAISPGMRMSVVCAEDAPFFTAAPDPGYLGELVDEAFTSMCAVWPRGEIPADFHQPVRSEKPVLLISGGADPATPPENAEHAAQTLPNSLHVVVPGMGHINIYRGCLPRLAAQFIEDGSTAGLDPACAEQITPLPFFINFNGPQP